MRIFLILLLFALSPQAHAKRIVMLTGFEPFGGRPVNSSAQSIEVLAASGLGERDGIEYKVCILPVEYDKAAKKAQECYEQIKPNMVISTGEGDCNVRLELRAHNYDDTPGFADNGGVVRESTPIERGAPAHELLTLPVPDLYCTGMAEMGPPLSTSISPGYYVCNNTAYHMARFLKPKQIPFGFVHVPVGDACRVNPGDTANRLHTIVRTSLRALSVPTTIFAQPGGALAPNPVDSAHLQNVPLPNVTPGCRQRVISQNRLALEREREMRERFQQMRRGDVAGPASRKSRPAQSDDANESNDQDASGVAK